MGEPEGCKGLGIRNATRLMMPPTKSTAEIMAGASEGIGLDTAMVFTKQSAGGEFFRINKVLLEIMKDKGVYNDETIRDIIKNKGSVQHVGWLTEHERQVFRTAFEVRMEDYLRLCSNRQKYIDQAQSINLYFTSNDSEDYISEIHRLAFEDEGILSLYYIYSMRGAGGITRVQECEVCQ
jgi:ribonucleoside-diphosphate reductase alpha chain